MHYCESIKCSSMWIHASITTVKIVDSEDTSRRLCGVILSSPHPPTSCDPLPHLWQTVVCSPPLKLGYLGQLEAFLPQTSTLFLTMCFSHEFIATYNRLIKQDMSKKVFKSPLSQWLFSIPGATPSKRKQEDFGVGRIVVSKKQSKGKQSKTK